jgi:hypothetical protein
MIWQTTLVKKFAAAALGVLATSLGVVPASVHLALMAVGILVLADTITGVTVAITRRDLKSSKMRSLIVKMVQYAALGLLGLGITVLTGSWLWLLGALWAVCSIETLSITENLVKLQKSGAKLGPAQKWLEKVAKFLADGQEGADSAGSSTATDQP